MKRIVLMLFVVLVVALFLAACGNAPPEDLASGEIYCVESGKTISLNDDLATVESIFGKADTSDGINRYANGALSVSYYDDNGVASIRVGADFDKFKHKDLPEGITPQKAEESFIREEEMDGPIDIQSFTRYYDLNGTNVSSEEEASYRLTISFIDGELSIVYLVQTSF